ncbi:hypothetical protein pdul_cds_792 [Pandoravirus dulcis]|uniref:Uncharacterized protein n=1 Tax=Pandoravirus dulcis TaxID=1349409 RepID=S4VYQ1_9VIRU|nr:hypothetical protein pdul_cds_792 [Pandoravirus dulcis]AGO82989.1 hypothetical protein pdul_cds_792 [Pandoravirus dulcis]
MADRRGGRLAEWATHLTELCARIARGAGTPDDMATLGRLLDGASFDVLLGEGATSGSGNGLVTRYGRFWAALDRDPNALAAVAREARGWPPSIVDAAMAYVRVSEWKAMAMLRALAHDEAQGTQWLSDATAPERLVALLGSATRHADERLILPARRAATTEDEFVIGRRTPAPGDGSIVGLYDTHATALHGVPPSPVIDPYPHANALSWPAAAHDAFEHADGPVVVAYRSDSRAHQHDDQMGGGSDCDQEGAWWARVCRTPDQEPRT